VKTLFDEQIYRLGNWLYRAVKIDGESVVFESRRINRKYWYRGRCNLNSWRRDISDIGDLYEDAV